MLCCVCWMLYREYYFYNAKHYFEKCYSKKSFSSWPFSCMLRIHFPFSEMYFLSHRLSPPLMDVCHLWGERPLFVVSLMLPSSPLPAPWSLHGWHFSKSIWARRGKILNTLITLEKESRKVSYAFERHPFNFNILRIKRCFSVVPMTFSVETWTVP